MAQDREPPVPAGPDGPADGAWAPTERLGQPNAPTLRVDTPEVLAGQVPAAPAGDPDLELLASQRRFRVERLLGEGGMGKVYRAFDEELGRPVAIKVLFATDREADERFAREARAQARVDHPHVGKIYETGAIGSRRYIVMQYIAGQTLGAAAAGLTVEEKVAVLRRVCEGVHAAHRIGLVHRDLKPSNVLVDRGDDGALHPYVLDFGIARDVAAGQTATAGIVGTPWYMAPEQIAGLPVDRRADVYALGVTLYQVLAGKLPITGTGSVDVLVRVLQEEPVPLLEAAPRLPGELGVIVMKCLEKDPARRYDSARALGDDLGRFLDGEPIAARPATWGYRWAKRVRKHRLPFAIAGAALAALLALGGFALRELWLAGRLEALGERYGIVAERAEWRLRAERQLPLHDTRPAEDRLRAELAALGTEVAALPPRQQAPGLFALGRVALALGDVADAERWLDQAWQRGARDPEHAFWRGRVKALRLRAALDAARRQTEPARRSQAIADAFATYRDDAVALLERGRAAPFVAAAYGEALLHWADGRPEETIALAERMAAEMPYLYEAHLLAGDAHRELAHRAGDETERTQARARAESAYATAAAIAPSDSAPHHRLCALALERAQDAPAEGAAIHVEMATGHCERALSADGRDAAALELRDELTRLGAAAARPGAP